MGLRGFEVYSTIDVITSYHEGPMTRLKWLILSPFGYALI